MADTKRSSVTSALNIYQKIGRIQRAVDIVQKDASGYGYNYVSEAVLLPRITAEMEEVGVSLIPSITPGTTTVQPYSYEKKNGDKIKTVNEFSVTSQMQYVWVNNDNPEDRIVVPWFMTGNQEDSSQAFGSALTYSERYFLLKFFHVATVKDDPDAIRSKVEEDRSKSDLEATIKAIDQIVQEVISSDPSQRETITEMVTRFADIKDEKGQLVRTSNYHKITKKARAAGLLKELTAKYKEEK